MPKLKSQDESGISIYEIKSDGSCAIVECETIYDIDRVALDHSNSNSRKERKELSDQYQVLAKQYNDHVNFKAFKPSL